MPKIAREADVDAGVERENGAWNRFDDHFCSRWQGRC
jgi:hypothetical protein